MKRIGKPWRGSKETGTKHSGFFYFKRREYKRSRVPMSEENREALAGQQEKPEKNIPVFLF
jgi:hypothetical protein